MNVIIYSRKAIRERRCASQAKRIYRKPIPNCTKLGPIAGVADNNTVPNINRFNDRIIPAYTLFAAVFQASSGVLVFGYIRRCI